MSKTKTHKFSPKHPSANEETCFLSGFSPGFLACTLTALKAGKQGGASPLGAAAGWAVVSCHGLGWWMLPCPLASFRGSPSASLQGMTLAKEIRDQERGGRTYIAVVDGENEKESPQLMEVMNQVLGKRRELKAAVPDTVVEPALKAALKLYQ